MISITYRDKIRRTNEVEHFDTLEEAFKFAFALQSSRWYTNLTLEMEVCND